MDETMDIKRTTYLLLLTLGTTYAQKAPIDISIGGGYTHTVVPHIAENTPAMQYAPNKMAKYMIHLLSTDYFTPYMSLELTSPISDGLSKSLLISMDYQDDSLSSYLYEHFRGAQIATMLKYHSDNVSYSIGTGVSFEKINYRFPKHTSSEYRTIPSFNIGGEIKLNDKSKLHLSTSLTSKELEQETSKDNCWYENYTVSILSRVGLSYQFDSLTYNNGDSNV